MSTWERAVMKELHEHLKKMANSSFRKVEINDMTIHN